MVSILILISLKLEMPDGFPSLFGFRNGESPSYTVEPKSNGHYDTEILTEGRMADEGWLQCSECPSIITFSIAEFMKKLGFLECSNGHRCEYSASLIKRGKPPNPEGIAAEGWNFTIIGCDSQDVPKYLGFKRTREEADKYQKQMENLGWRRVAVFDAALREQKRNE